jgi:hypothetical protein
MVDDAVVQRIERCEEIDPAMAERIGGALARAFPAQRFDSEEGRAELVSAAGSTDALLHIVDEALDFWTVKIAGKTNETDGHWVCTLRRSSMDDDERMAIGRSPALPRALLAAFVQAARRMA